MFYVTKYSFNIEKDLLDVHDYLKKDIVGTIEHATSSIFVNNKTPFNFQFDYDRYILSEQARPFRKTGISPDTFISLVKIEEKNTQIDVKIRYSDVSYMFLIFPQILPIIVFLSSDKMRFFGTMIKSSWGIRILMMCGSLAVINFIIWAIYKTQVKHYRNILMDIFKQ